jgi:hypothetical protein
MAARRVVLAPSSAKADSLLRSSALRTTAVLGFIAVALACSNLMLARCFRPAGRALRSFFAIVQIAIKIDPFGTDVMMTRRHYGPGSHILLNGCFLAVRNAL